MNYTNSKLSANTLKVYNYIMSNGTEGLKTDELISGGINPKQLAAAVSVLVQKGLIEKSPFIVAHKLYLKNKSAHDESSLRELINEFLDKKTYSTKPLISFFKVNPNELSIMNSITGINNNIVKSLWHFMHGPDVPVCKVCQKSVTFKNYKIGYNDFCTNGCGSQNMWNNADETFISDRTAKIKETCITNHGVDWGSKMKDHGAKIKSTSLLRYNETNASKNKEIKSKMKIFFDEKYGGTGNGSPITAAKIQNTLQERYGVDWAWQIPEVQDKIQEARYMFKDYTFPSGRKERVQGYEPRALDWLISENVLEGDIVVSNAEMAEFIGNISYIHPDGKKRRYFPDFYIKSTNTIIEVKSAFTYYGGDHQEVMFKKDAAVLAGFNFRFMVFDGNHLLNL